MNSGRVASCFFMSFRSQNTSADGSSCCGGCGGQLVPHGIWTPVIIRGRHSVAGLYYYYYYYHYLLSQLF
jgi:hypothetical protein